MIIAKRLILLLLTLLSSSYAIYAQDPFVGEITFSPDPIQVGQVASFTASFGNGSPIAIPQSATAIYTFNIPPDLGLVGSPVVVINSGAITTANLSVTVIGYSAQEGTIILIRSDKGNVPGDAVYSVILPIVGVEAHPTLPSVLFNAVASGIGTNDPNNDNTSTFVTVTAGALPVALVSFMAKTQEDHTVRLDWTTSLETNNKGFLIERSKDLKSFEMVGELTELSVNSNSLKNYHLTDLTPYQGTSYYQLTQIDLNGNKTVYPAVSVVVRDDTYGVFPNPVVNNQPFRLSLDEPDTAVINLYGVNGQILPCQKVGVGSGSLIMKATSKLSTGVYILTVEERGQTRKHRLVVE